MTDAVARIVPDLQKVTDKGNVTFNDVFIQTDSFGSSSPVLTFTARTSPPFPTAVSFSLKASLSPTLGLTVRHGANDLMTVASDGSVSALSSFQADGTQSLPGFSFKSSPDTGFFRVSEDVIGVSCASTEKVRISGVEVGFKGPVVIGELSDASSSAVLDIQSSSKGVLFPQLSSVERNAISSPADGLTIYNTTNKTLEVFDSSAVGAPAWKRLFEERTSVYFRSGLYYNGTNTSTSTSTVSLVANALRAQPFPVPKLNVFDRISLNVSTLAAASSIRLGIYKDDGTGFPGSLVVDAGTVSSTTTGVKEITISQTLPAGLYWLAYISNGSPTLTAAVNTNAYAPLGFTSPSSPANRNMWAIVDASAFTALPATFPAGATVSPSNIPICLRSA